MILNLKSACLCFSSQAGFLHIIAVFTLHPFLLLSLERFDYAYARHSGQYTTERGGWSTTDTLKAEYQHTFSDERKHVDKLIDGFFDDILRD